MRPEPETEIGADEYFQQVEEHFVRLRGAPLVLSPADWQLAAEWRRQGIPLGVVLRALSQVFATAASRGRRKPVLSLAYCRHEVEAEFGRWRDALAGGGGGKSASGRPPADRRLEAKALRLEARLAGWPEPLRPLGEEAGTMLRRAAVRLRGGDAGPEALENELALQERDLMDRLAAALEPSERTGIEESCRQRLEPFRGRMIDEEYRRTLRHARDEALRRRLGLPRLSLLSD